MATGASYAPAASSARPDAPRRCSPADAMRRSFDRWAGVGRGLGAPRLILRRNVVQHRRQPALGLDHAPALARGVILDLIALDLADAEIGALGVAEIEPRYRRARPHREALGQLHAGGVLRIEQVEQRRLLGVIGLRGIARRGADAADIARGSGRPASTSRPAHNPRIPGARAACMRSAKASASRSASALHRIEE